MNTERHHVLVVDDERHVREILSRWLLAAGFIPHVAATAEAAWGMLETAHCSLLMADIRLPGKSGIELLEMTKQAFGEDVAVIMITAVNDADTATEALQRGASGYVTKPFDRNDIITNVLAALERRDLMCRTLNHEHQLEGLVRARTEALYSSQEEIVLRLMSAAEFRDDETGAHIRRIGLYAGALAEAAGLATSITEQLRLAGTMHDIGKIGVPDSILLKPGRLTEQEFGVVKGHCEIGARILEGSDIPLLDTAREIALCHHEKWDGSGYPRGLAGEAIPMAARIVALVDVYDALVNRRVYRPALPEKQALQLMSKEKSKHFDPYLFERFVGILPELRQIREVVHYVQSFLPSAAPLGQGALTPKPPPKEQAQDEGPASSGD